MIGIDIGAAHVTFSAAANLPPLMHSAPADLAHRVAADLPVITIKKGRCQTTNPADAFAKTVADALACLEPSSTSSSHEDLPVRAAIAVPGWWSPSTLARVNESLSQADVDVTLINDAEAAVAGWSGCAESPPRTYAVVSLRDESVSVVLVQTGGKQPKAFLSPTFVVDEGGQFLDSAILRHLVVGIKDMGVAFDVKSDAAISEAHQALSLCRELREKLSYSSAESIKLGLGENSKTVRIARSELEELAEPWLENLVSNLGSVIGQSRSGVDEVLLVGGLAAMPLISQRISAELDMPVTVAANAQTVVSEGTQLLAERATGYFDRVKAAWRNGGNFKFWRLEHLEKLMTFLGFPPNARLQAHRAGAKNEH